MDDERTANLLGVLVVALGDELETSAEAAAGHGGAAPAALVTAAQFPGETVGSLGTRVGLSQPAGVRVVDRLQEAGLVRREGRRRSRQDHDPDDEEHQGDGRRVGVLVTDAGQETAAQVLAARARVLEDALAALSPDERAQLADLLEKMLMRITVDVPHARLVCRLCDVPSCPQDRCPVTLGARGGRPGGADSWRWRSESPGQSYLDKR